MTNRKLRMILIEDDHYQRNWIAENLRKDFQPFQAEVETLSSESEFLRRKDALNEPVPDIFVVDVMVPWNNSDDLDPSVCFDEAPKDRQDEREAGVRIMKDIQATASLKKSPVVLYTVLDSTDLPKGVTYVPKEATIAPLSSVIRQRLGIRAVR